MKDMGFLLMFIIVIVATNCDVSWTHNISDVEDLSRHGLFVMGWSWSEPQLLECLIHQFLWMTMNINANKAYKWENKQSHVSRRFNSWRKKKGADWIHTLIPSSSLTLRIILTHISVILLKVGCSRQMSLRILITRFLTLIPVSCVQKTTQSIKDFATSCKHVKNKAFVCIYKCLHRVQ